MAALLTEIMRLDALGMRFAIYRNGKNIGEDELGRGALADCGSYR